MTTSTDDSLDISAQLFWQSTTPTSSATQTKSAPALSQSGSTSAPDIHTSCPTQASRSATGKKNFTWSGADVLHLVTILYNSKSYQHALLPSRESAESNPALKLCKHPIFREISKLIFPGASVEPNCIKAKLRWLQETYYREKKKLSLTGAGMLLEDMDASNPGTDIPMDLSGSKLYDHSAYGHGLPPILDLMDSTNPPAAVASTSGASIAGAGDDDFFTTPSPLQARPSFSMAGGLDVFDSTSSHSSAQRSPGTKHKRGALDHKRDTLAEAFYRSSINTLQIHLQLEQECTRHERMLEAERTKHEEMRMRGRRKSVMNTFVHVIVTCVMGLNAQVARRLLAHMEGAQVSGVRPIYRKVDHSRPRYGQADARDLAGTGSRHGQSAVSMETMEMEDQAICEEVQAPPQ
ncbi:uncharacterized protein UDID_17424 [Ustilago sp. UG-2017a]|nr:uncharacterized protein UDID_17424 [Ustilago sp. UG-2017a]